MNDKTIIIGQLRRALQELNEDETDLQLVYDYVEYALATVSDSTSSLVWIPFQPNISLSHPPEPNKYLICRKDGQVHWEQWNGTRWNRNDNAIISWAHINHPTDEDVKYFLSIKDQDSNDPLFKNPLTILLNKNN